MITLNLLSTAKKEQARKENIFIALNVFLIIILVFLVLDSALLATAKIISQNSFFELTTRSSLLLGDRQKLSTEIQEFNRKLKTIQEVQKNYIKWSNFLIDINNLIPANIQLSLLNIDKGSQVLSIEGRAKSRDDFLMLKKNFENCQFLSEIKSPLSNLIPKESVKFTITAKINLNYEDKQ